MDAKDDNAPLEPRLPTTDDLLLLCRRLNEAGAKYLVLGGFAIIQHGFARATEDIDLLIETSPENFAKVKAAMMGLPDGAVKRDDMLAHIRELVEATDIPVNADFENGYAKDPNWVAEPPAKRPSSIPACVS